MRNDSENDTSFQQIEEQNAQLLALFLASQRLSSTLDPEAVQATIFEILVEFAGAAIASLWLRDDRHGGAYLASSRGLEDATGRRVILGEGVISSVIATGDEFLDGVEQADAAIGLPILAAIPLLLDGN